MRASFSKKEKIFLLALFVVSLTVGLALTMLLRQHYMFYNHPSADVTYYMDWAHEIATKDFIGTKTFFGLPLYPYFLAVLFRISLGHIEVIRFFHLILSAFNCLLLYYAAKLIFSKRIAVVASVLMALNFILTYYAWLMMPVTLLITLSLIIVIALVQREQLTQKHQWFFLGLFIGASTLGDGKFLFFLMLTAVWLWLERPERLKQILMMLLGAALIVGGCAARNKIVGGDWVLISAQSGLSFFSGNNPEATGVYLNPDFIRPTHHGQDEDQRIVAESIARHTMSPGEISAFWKAKAMDFIYRHPDQYARLLVKKFILFFRETEYADDLDLVLLRNWKAKLDWNNFLFLMPLALIGVAVSARQWKKQPFPVMLIGCQLLVTLIFFLSTRHRATVFPFLLMFEAAAVFWFIKQLRRRNFIKISLAVVFVLFYALLLPPVRIDAKTITYNEQSKAGAVFAAQGQPEKAKACYLKVLAIKPTDSTTLYNLANLYVEEQNWSKAQALYQQSLTICSFNVDALFNLGFVYEQQGKVDLALKYYKTVLRYQPDSPDIYFRMASL
ncbi:MAG TPA: tetratricopeptide repeat protein, partial [Candidatus Bathyarchaeia archaeon]|nr:tetratricopeptide repeat protein [Candidatus Bathyarchaeia archaeon]